MSKDAKNFIAFDKNSRAVEGIGTAQELLDTLSTEYSFKQLREDVEIYALGEKVKLHVLLTGEQEQAI